MSDPYELLREMKEASPSGRGWWRRLVVWEDEDRGVVDEQASLERVPRHDASVGDEIIREYPGRLFSVPDAGRSGSGVFRVWEGRMWAEDLGGGTLGMLLAEYWEAMGKALDAISDAVRERARAEAESMGLNVEEAMQAAMEQFRKRWKRHLDYHESLGNTARRRAIRDYLGQHRPVILSDDDFDTVPEFMVLRNGVLDLGVTERVFVEGGEWNVELMPHDPVRKVTMCAALDYDPSAVAVEFLQYLERALPLEEQRRYLQKVLGSTLTGRPRDRMMVNLIGPPATGKSVLLEVMDSVLGDYCEFVMANVFLVPRGGSARDANAAMPSLHAMRKAKLVVASEPDSKSEWNSGLLKAISGRDAIRSRALYKDEVRWTPRFVVVVASNDYIRLDVKDEAMIRRIHPVEFSVQFRFPGVGEEWEDVPAEQRADPNLTSKIIGSEVERSGVLNWLLEGLRMYLEEGIGETSEVVRAREVMVRGMSEPLEWLGQMLEEGVLVQAPKGSTAIPIKYTIGLKIAYNLFMNWRMENEEFGPYKLKTFRTQIGNEASNFGPAGLKRRGYTLSTGEGNEYVLDRLAWADWQERYRADGA